MDSREAAVLAGIINDKKILRVPESEKDAFLDMIFEIKHKNKLIISSGGEHRAISSLREAFFGWSYVRMVTESVLINSLSEYGDLLEATISGCSPIGKVEETKEGAVLAGNTEEVLVVTAKFKDPNKHFGTKERLAIQEGFLSYVTSSLCYILMNGVTTKLITENYPVLSVALSKNMTESMKIVQAKQAALRGLCRAKRSEA